MDDRVCTVTGPAAGDRGVFVVAHVDIAGPQASAPDLLKKLAEASRKDEGNLRFDVLQHAMRANHFTVVESWQSQKAPTPAERRYFPPLQTRGPEVVRPIGSTPDEPFSQIYVTLISAINSAESEILLTNAYFVPDPQLMQALIAAVEFSLID